MVSDADAFVKASKEALAAVTAQMMLTDGIANAYRQGCQRMQGVSGVAALLTSEELERSASPYLLETTAANWLANPGTTHLWGAKVLCAPFVAPHRAWA